MTPFLAQATGSVGSRVQGFLVIAQLDYHLLASHSTAGVPVLVG